MITGHSMGAAMASFCALDLVVSAKPCPDLKRIKFEHLFKLHGKLCSINRHEIFLYYASNI
jgi:hypothetical protein